MPQYLVAIHHPDDYDPFIAEDEAMARDIVALNVEMKAAGVRIFVGGLQHVSSAEVAAGEARWQGADHRRAVPGDQGARGRFLGAGSR